MKTEIIDEASERWIIKRLLETNLPPQHESIAIDIGAGPPPAFWKIFLRYCSRTICVEPALILDQNPYSKSISELLEAEKLGEVELYRGVVSDTNGVLAFQSGKESTMISSLNPEYRIDEFPTQEERERYLKEFNTVSVNSLTYNELCKAFHVERPWVVKVDVEGAEERVLRFMNAENAPAILLIEFQYVKPELISELRRLLKCGAFKQSLFIKKPEGFAEVIGEYIENQTDMIFENPDAYYGSLFLFRTEAIKGVDFKKLRQDLYQRIRIEI